MLVICAGMFRSGSTWQYQIACELAGRGGLPTQALGFLEGARLVEFLAAPRDPAVCHIYKTHPPNVVHLSLDPAETRILYCYRDLRDVAYSMVHKYSGSFAEVVGREKLIEKCLESDAFWGAIPGVLVQRYEEWLRDNLPFVRRIAAALGIGLAEAAYEAIAEKYSLDRNRNRTEDIAAHFRSDGVDLSDPANALLHDSASLLHWNHIRSGSVGQWRQLATADEKAFLHAACGDWLVARGYEPDHTWATSVNCVDRTISKC